MEILGSGALCTGAWHEECDHQPEGAARRRSGYYRWPDLPALTLGRGRRLSGDPLARRVEAATWAAALCGASRREHRAALHEPTSERASPRDVYLRRLCAAPVQLHDQVRQRHRMAELLA